MFLVGVLFRLVGCAGGVLSESDLLLVLTLICVSLPWRSDGGGFKGRVESQEWWDVHVLRLKHLALQLDVRLSTDLGTVLVKGRIHHA
jgi:hypothetical protein